MEPVGRSPVPLAECALARAIRTIGDGWSLLILREALCGVERFDAMCEDLAIPRSVLADRLARLVEAGILEQTTYREPGQRSRKAYILSEKGRALIPALVALRAWAEDHLPGGRSRLRLHDKDGQEIFAHLLRADRTRVEDFAGIKAVAAPQTPPSPHRGGERPKRRRSVYMTNDRGFRCKP
jgi:DNA-binding HxlR family transcriptional regulator